MRVRTTGGWDFLRKRMDNSKMDKIQKKSDREWSFVAYGTSVDLTVDEKTGLPHNGCSGSVTENNLSVWSLNGKGKLVPASTDGLAFYYTKLDAATENFTLEADITVEQWTFSNGQDGFGIMVCDTIGEHGEEASLWNNAYMAAATKVIYNYDKEKNKLSSQGAQYIMRLGVGALEKRGVTQDNLARGTQVNAFVSEMTTLETTAAMQNKEPGNYNLVGGYQNQGVDMHSVGEVTTFHLSVQRNNTGYIVSYRNAEGQEASKLYYHGTNGDELTQLDNDTIYAGFFAARNAKIAMRNVKLEIIAPQEDAPAKPRAVALVEPKVVVLSAKCANREEYELVLYSNFDGKAVVRGLECEIKANTRCKLPILVELGRNVFDIVVTPDVEYRPSDYERLSSYENIVLTHSVEREKRFRDTIYISPVGENGAEGSRLAPMNIYEAVRVAAPGQTLILLEGHYQMEGSLVIERGMDGNEEQPITLKADEDAKGRPVLDFRKRSPGMIVAANYWHLQGFAVTGSMDGKVGVQIAGRHNILERVHSYGNGNTGIQISRYLIQDAWEDWPAHNLILNCTSYLNADSGYTDSDGFAAKITVAEGNVFDGCISAYNADDGFDLFAKVEHGATGSVLIRNCLAFRNGYTIDADGNEQHRGLGNGFKLGGSSIACGHRLENSISFGNGEKGIDSNNAPDVRVKNAISYENETHNLGLYTTDAPETSFVAGGILSYKSKGTVAERLQPKGQQDLSAIYNASNYYFDGEKSANMEGQVVRADWFCSLDMEAAIHGGITRNEDGSICMNGFLELTQEAPEGVGVKDISGKQECGKV